MRCTIIRWLGWGLVAAALFAPAGGCGKKTGELDAMEERLPRMEEAKRLDREEKYEAAVALYREILAENPDLAKAHLELALLVDQKLHDDVAAIYHYRRYLELRPDTEKRAMLEELIRYAEFAFASSVTNHPSAVLGEMNRLKEQIRSMEADLDTARGRITDLKRSLSLATARAADAEARLQGAPPRPAAPAEVPSVPVEPEPRTYRVQRGDTLSKIAAKVYNDASKWREIYEANRETMKRSSDLDVGQVLVIP